MYGVRQALMALSFLNGSGRCLALEDIDAEGANEHGKDEVPVEMLHEPQGVTLWSNSNTQL